MENITYDFKRICRACKNESAELRYLFEDDGNSVPNPRIDEMLMACTSLKVNCEDGLPNSICQSCADQLHKAYDFKQLCESTDTSLRDYLRGAKDNRVVKQELVSQINELEVDTSNILDDINTVISNDVHNESSFENENVKEETDEVNPALNKDFIELLEDNQMLLTCRTCAKCFTTLDGLKCHKRLHTGGLFSCKECGKQYTRQNHLQRHEMSHGRRKMHICKICNKTLTRFEHLKRHLTTHLKEKPFSCATCNRGFNRSEHLMNHAKRCKGDRVHICNVCNKGFNREDSLELHKRLHENKLPVLPTLDNLDNIEEHYFEIDFDGNSVLSDTSEIDTTAENISDCFEPQVNICENLDQIKVDHEKAAEMNDIANLDDEIYAELDPQELIDEKDKIENELCKNEEDSDNDNMENETDYFMNNDDDNHCENIKEDLDDVESTYSEYLPSKPLKTKRKRGRPRKSDIPVVKQSTRPRGRPPVKIKVEPDDEMDIEGEFCCTACNKVFSTMILLEKHSQKHEGMKLYPCAVCSKKFSRSNHLKRHMMSHSTDKPFVCEVCKKSFNRRDHLMQHRKLHSRAQEYECDICKRMFGRADHLAKHKASKHNIGEKIMGEKRYKCGVCLKGFTTEKYRDVHMKGHSGEKKYQCKTCDKSFISKSHLTEHMKFHNDNSKKYLCSECGQRFIRNDYLVIHMRRHRGEKPFKCKYCGKGFPRTTDLTVHERYHTGEKTHLCTICGRGFGRAYNLTVHMRTHTGEKPYQCTYCEAAFAQGNDLKAHVRRHTGERFQCELCSENFLMGYLLTQHKRTVHGLNVVSNIRRLQPIDKMNQSQSDEPPPIAIPLPTPMVPSSILNAQLQSQLAVAQIHQMKIESDMI